MAIDFEGNLNKLDRRARQERKIVNDFLRSGKNVPQGGTFLDDIAAQVASGREARAQQRLINRTIGAGPWQGRSTFTGAFDPSMVNPTGQTPAGAVGRSPLALGPGSGGGTVATTGQRALAPINQPASVASGQPALPAGPQQPIQATYAAADDIGAGVRSGTNSISGRIGAAGRSSAQAAGQAAASPVDDIAMSVAGGAGGSGGGSGIAAAAGAGGNAARTSMLANVTKASLMRGAGVAGAGYLASGIIDSMNVGGENSDFDRILSGASLGAGLGAGGAIALGLGTGPVGWAALGGAAIFGGAKYLFGDDKTSMEKMTQSITETRENIESIAMQYGLSPDAIGDVMMQYDMSTQLYADNEDKDGLKAYLTGLSQTLPAMMLQQKQIADQEQMQQDRYQQMINVQANFAPIFESQLTRASQASERAMATADQTAGYLEQNNPNLSALIRQSAAQSNESAQRLYSAYAQQMAMAPGQAADAYDLQNRMAQQEALLAQMASPVG